MRLPAVELYEKYDEELRRLAYCLRRQYHRMQHRGYITAFSDVEGEFMYMLIRETQPDTVFEISPASGWSTNYILAALTTNEKGVVHSFELSPKIQGRPTEEVIRNNQCTEWNQQRLIVHIGDARETVPRVGGPINFLLLDSCHDDWFAQWYIETLFPRVNGLAFVQDIAFIDQLEPSSEAKHLWTWLSLHEVDLVLLGSIEAALQSDELRKGYPERNSLRSNAIVFVMPQTASCRVPTLINSPEDMIAKAKEATLQGGSEVADSLLNEATDCLLRGVNRANRHRAFCQAGLCYDRFGEKDEARRCFQRALGVVMQGNVSDRVKGLPELLEFFMAKGRWTLTAQIAAIMLFEPKTWFRVVQRAKAVFLAILRRVATLGRVL